MSDQRRFCRVYYDDMLRDHADVWRDDALLSTWLRLLVAAEKAWPSWPEVPRSAKRRAVVRLIEAGMLSVTPDQHYELRGFKTDREMRAQSASYAAASRWRNAPAMPIPEQTEKETRPEDDPAWLRSWFLIGRTRMPTPGQQAVIDSYLRAFDVTGPERLSNVFLGTPDDPIGAAKLDLSAFREEAKAKAQADEQEAAKRHETRHRGSGLTGINAELAKLMRQKDDAA